MNLRNNNIIIFSILMTFITVVLFLSHPVKAVGITGAPGSFQIDFIDVGQGDSALIQCDNHYMLIDGGSSDRSSLIYSYLKKRGIQYLDYMVATHADADHIGGLAGALYYATVGTAYCPVTTSDTKTFRNFVKYLNSRGKSITVPSYGDTFSLGGSTVTVLGPAKAASEDNNSSIVLRIVYGETSFLLTLSSQEFFSLHFTPDVV